ncbi:hypothetical protein OG762_46550 [Streptomyces sp. NBC_01136]|uniref:hypothetical protein n=1 Tax=unclassified Streptomyces TaxID=2593676 RepID=UPI00324F1248|nr:hypothetical protein OG762_00075 [Streptomyces sp. NBC_01136]WST81234.1 hypothetical protein OG762_46550 [Streptomyces sp. NBC_01136]
MGEREPADGDTQDALDWGRRRLEEMGVFAAQDGLRWAAAHGLVRSVWRNGPIEDAHASRPTGRRKALHDGTMFARNTWLTRQAFDVLGSDDQFRLYALEDLVLDRDMVWPGCEGTLTDFGWGFLGEIKKHVKQRIDMFGHFEQRLLPDDFLVFAGAPWLGARDDHYGMPRWPACVEAAMRRLRGEDEEFWHARGDLMTRIGPAPAAVTADLEATRKRLLESPWELGAGNLGWFAWNPILQSPGTTP